MIFDFTSFNHRIGSCEPRLSLAESNNSKEAKSNFHI